ncbi:hypothetical protein J2X55_002627 [Microbacterium sp. 1154]|uniref:hypothetical protein n=1 Tax=Microbacterium sp. 1154 TaxID=2817733 RepID=UPI00286448B0|nr:hypothetical protein [Microbacterium sp. 1154]MDR6691704.1 hypothetical protein [Microbacterium sp. 1154]
MTDSPGAPSLIQQRMALTRTRNLAVLATVGMVFTLSAQIARLIGANEKTLWLWMGVIVFIGLTCIAAASVSRAVRAIRAFEAENGRDAGRQKPPHSR